MLMVGRLLGITNATGTAITSASHVATLNPFRYRGYYYDTETGLYSLQSRYYDPVTGRFINADNQLSTGSDLTGINLFAYCGNNPIMRSDPAGQAWWHWAIAAAVVVGCVVATVVTAGGFAAGAAAIGMAASGISVGGAAGVFAAASIGSGMALGTMAMAAASTSNSVSEFNGKGNWGTVAGTVVGGGIGGASGYSNSGKSNKSPPNPNGKKGGAAHQAEIAKQTAKFNPSQIKYEVKINTPGGMKPYRYADFSVTQNGQTWYGNVGKQLQSGLPCARERYAISDIQGAGGTIRFFPYN